MLCTPGFSFAETITLKSGKKIEGLITEKTDQYIKVEAEGAPLYFERKFISRIDEEAASLTDADCLKEGLKYGSQGKFPEAEEALKKGLALNSKSGNLQEALKLIDRLKDGEINEDYALRLFKGSYDLIIGRFEEAMPEFLAALAINPGADLYYYLGVCSYSAGKYEDAIQYLKKAAEEIKDDGEVYYNLGINYYALRQYAEAVPYLQKALEIDPENAEAYGVLGTSHLMLGERERAKEELCKSRDLFRKQGDYLKAADVETFLKQVDT